MDLRERKAEARVPMICRGASGEFKKKRQRIYEVDNDGSLWISEI